VVSWPPVTEGDFAARAARIERFTDQQALELLEEVRLRELFRGRVHFDICGPAGNGALGRYLPATRPAPYDFPRIRLHRAHQRKPDPSEQECVTIMHEYGHFLSDQAGFRDDAYEEALRKFNSGLPLVDADQALVIAEEERAWVLGRGALLELERQDLLPAYDERRIDTRNAYAARLHPGTGAPAS
jgi:hypothetical protein